MYIISLSSGWYFKEEKGKSWYQAVIPGCVHMDLMRNNLIPDPYYRDNECFLQWIGEKNWIYFTTFNFPVASASYKKIIIRFEGIDTIANVKFNEHIIGYIDNMFRVWEFDITKLIRHKNLLEVLIFSPLKYVRTMNRIKYLPAWGVKKYKVDGGGWIRKEPCNFGWDWGPMLVTCGVWRPVKIICIEKARIYDVAINQIHYNSEVKIILKVYIEKLVSEKLFLNVKISFEGRQIAYIVSDVKGKINIMEIDIPEPQLWWPNNIGEQNLYNVNIDVVDINGKIIDSKNLRIGLRSVELVQKKDRWGKSFYFKINGIPFFAKGANWIPADTFIARISPDRYKQLLTAARNANMNMLRVWGGGIYEEDCFYDICDELGLCIWQDFIFACSTYPAFDKEFLKNVEHEAIDNIRRIRHHPCVVLWCGNNELEQGLVSNSWTESTMSFHDYSKLFDKLLKNITHKYTPETPYWPSSPHTPGKNRKDANNRTCGDQHLWGVWHSSKPFSWYNENIGRFVSEFGFQSFPDIETIKTFTLPEDRNITSKVMELHQRHPVGNKLIMNYMLEYFKMPQSFEQAIYLSQILQAIAVKTCVENARIKPYCMGTLYWQLNDCWPVASWSSIDYYGRWKILHFEARRFFSPVTVIPQLHKNTVKIYVSNHRLTIFEGKLQWCCFTTDGKIISQNSSYIKIKPNTSICILSIKDKILFKDAEPENILFFVWLKEKRKIIHENLFTLSPFKYLNLKSPRIKLNITNKDTKKFTLGIRSDVPMLWTEIAFPSLTKYNLILSDNYFHIRPNRLYQVDIFNHSGNTINKDLILSSIKLMSLADIR